LHGKPGEDGISKIEKSEAEKRAMPNKVLGPLLIVL
jgi:hypothetical protein